MAYVWRNGADWGGGYLNTFAVDTLISGHYASGGDVFGQRQTLDGGNSWYPNNRGTKGKPDQTRAVYISQRPKTAGLTYWGTGNFGQGQTSPSGGGFFYTDFGDNALNPIDSTTFFGTNCPKHWIASQAHRAVGPMIGVDYDSGADKEYIYAATPTGFYRWVNAGANGAAISARVLLAPISAFGGNSVFQCICVFDANHVAVVNWDCNQSGVRVGTKIWMVHATDLRAASAGSATVSAVTINSSVNDSAGKPHIYDMTKGNDGLFYAACGYKGVAKVALSTHDLSWTRIAPVSGSSDDICATVDADSAGNLWIGQTGGRPGTVDYTNQPDGTVPGHGIIKGALSAGDYTYTYPASGGAIHEVVYQPGDTTTGTGGTWFLHGNNVSLGGHAYDSSLVRVDPFTNAKVSSCGRSGMWQTRNTGTSFWFAGHGLNGTEITAIKVQSNNHASAGGAASDWAEVHTTDNWVTCVQGSAVAAGSGATITDTQASIPYTGLDGAHYVLAHSTGFGGAKLTKQVGSGAVTDITDNFFRGASHLTGIGAAADGTVMVSTWGGVLVGDPSGTPTQPQINSFTPAAVSVGDTVTITGVRLTGMTSATVNGTQTATPTVVNSTTVTFVVPVGATTGFVGVSGPTGSAISSTALVVTATVPTISSFTPIHGLVGSSTVITGTNFLGVTDVRLNGVRCNFRITNSTHISADIPVGATSGKLSVSGIQSSGTFTVDAGTPPPGNFDDGDAHLATSQHYFGKIDTTAHAQSLASSRAVIAGQATLGAGGANNFSTFAPAMLAANPNLWILPYMKSVVHAPQDPTMPEAYYAHTCAGSRIQTGTANLDTMQPDGTANFSDPRGFAATSYRDWKGKDCWKVVDVFEATYPNTLQGTYLDSLGTISYANECNNGTPYTKPQWVHLIWTIPDHAVSQRPTGIVFCNGLQNAQAYYFPDTSTGLSLAPLLTHCDGGVAERWLRDNYQPFGTWPALTGVNSWSNSIQMIIDADTVQNSYIWCVVNIANNVPGNQPAGFVAYTTGQINQWKRFSYCTFMLGQRGRALYEFVSASTTKPWDETHTYWTTSLGDPSEATATTAGMLHSGLYRRLYADGAVFVNPAATGQTITADRDYLDPISGASIATGATITVAAHDGLLLTVDPGGNPNTDSPVVAITSPANGATILATTPVHLNVNATDDDGIATVSASLDAGAGFALALTTAPQYTKALGLLQPGNHTIAVTATDSNASPLTSAAAVNFTVSVAPPPANTPPSVFISSPGDVIVLPATVLVTANATDVDGIASVTVALDGGTPAAMSATTAGNYQLSLGTLAEGSHRIDVKATDSNASPLSTTVSKTFLVTTNGDGGGGGGGGGDGGGDGGGGTGDGTPLVISTDIQDIEIRFKDRGLVG